LHRCAVKKRKEYEDIIAGMERKDIGKRTTLDYKRLRNFQVFRFEGMPPFLSRLQDVPEATNKDGQVLLTKLKKVRVLLLLI
jgi:hypothetical protein